MRRLIFSVLCLLLLGRSVVADDKIAAEEFLKDKLNAIIAVLQKKDIDPGIKNSELDEIITAMLDFSLMAKLALGRKYWRELTEENRERFTDLFVKLLKALYLKNMTLYTGERVNYGPPIRIKNKIQIPTFLILSEKKTTILYKLYKSQKDWQIYDIEIQDVSIIRSYRAQFTQILERRTIEDLLQELEKSVKSFAHQSADTSQP